MTVSKLLQERLQNALQRIGISFDEPLQIAATTDPRHGDYQTNVAMVLGKKLKQNPRNLAGLIVAEISVHDIGPPPEVAGPGFINFRLSKEFVDHRLHDLALDQRLGVERTGKPKTVVIDFSSPNIAKPMHVGHIRSTILGDVLAKITRFLGHKVITDNHIGDWGTQFGKVIYGWKHLLLPENLDADPVAELVRIYREADTAAKKAPEILEECRRELVKLQQGDEENRRIWQRCVDLSIDEFSKIYDRLGVQFDFQLGESFYNPELPRVVRELLECGLAEISDGAAVVWDRTLGGDPFIIRKSDGGYGYATTDIATLEYRWDRWRAEAIWYVVGAPQQLHFQQLFSLARRLGYEADLQHIAFGSILGEDRKLMRTRSGESIPLRTLLDEAVNRATAIVAEKNPELSEQDRLAIGEIVGIGAVKYAELSQHRMTDYIFSWDKMLSLQGNTAPYLQNAYVRCRSIFRKLPEPFTGETLFDLREKAEFDLAKKILLFPDVIPAILDGFKPNLLANYLYELAAEFHTFYESCPVLSAEPAVRETRLALCDVFSRLLRLGLELLGIQVPEKM
ncbi:MAG TPA: arginine--tRNA ligase [Chthoniobacterales bacterium]|jgi:arginyl-tRNA synthetase|nr:arginine--tRNA ligase [Chthoniobacterales bacterium]